MAEELKPVPDEVRSYMAQIGSKRTEAKTKATRENVAKAREARRRNPLDLVCTCTGGESLEASDHKTTCPRGRLLWQRERAAVAREAKEKATP
jgi:hypothetical protein